MTPAPPLLFPYDYYYLWAAGHLVLRGGNPYDLSQFTEAMYRIGWPREESIWGFTHPPWIFWIYTPFSLFDFEVARILWIATMLGLLYLVGILCQRLMRCSAEYCGSLPPALVVFALFCFPPTIKILTFGQVSMVMAVGLLAALVSLHHRRDFAAGLALSLTLIKPHLLFPFYIAVYLNSLRKGRWSVLLGTAVGLLAQVGVCTWIYPNGISDYLQYVPKLVQDSPMLPGATIIQVSTYQFGIPWLRLPVHALAVLVGIYYGTRDDLNLRTSLHLLLPLCLLLSPYAFSHEMILLAPSYLLVLSTLHERFGERAAEAACLVFGLLGVAMVTFIRFEFLAITISLALLAFAVRAGGSATAPRQGPTF